MHPSIVTGSPVDDVHGPFQPMEITQAVNLLKGKAHPSAYLSTLATSLRDPTIKGSVWGPFANRLLDMASLRMIIQVNRELAEAAAARKAGDTKAAKPADLYRKYSGDIRMIKDLSPKNAGLAKEAVTDLYLEQTLSDGDLENPDYVDPYTGEKEQTFEEWAAQIPDRHQPGVESLIRDILSMPEEGDGFDGAAAVLPGNPWQTELEDMAKACQKDLGWTDQQVQEFVTANTQFIGGEDEYEPMDDRGYVPPTLSERELVIDRQVFYQAMKSIRGFNMRRAEIFARMKILHVNGANWYPEFRTLLTVSEEYASLIKTITDIADTDITTAAAVVLTVANGQPLEETDTDEVASLGYGLIAEDIAGITGAFSEGSRLNLIDYVNEWQDDILDLLGDAGLNGKFLTSEEDIERFDATTRKLLDEKMPEYDVNPMQTRSWNSSYFQAIANGSTFPEADEAAWNGWRFAMSPEGAQAYNATFKATHDRKASMRAFWNLAPSVVPRPQDYIKAIRGDKQGLVLESDRRIDWKIAALKAKQHELCLTDEIKGRLRVKLDTLPAARIFLEAI